MITTIFEVIYEGVYDGDGNLQTWLFNSWEAAKEKFDAEVAGDKKEMQRQGLDVVSLKGVDLYEGAEDGQWVLDEDETHYTVYEQGNYCTNHVEIFIKEHTLEVK